LYCATLGVGASLIAATASVSLASHQGVPQLERALVHDATPLIHEYHSKVLGRLAKLLNLYDQAQAARLGLNVIQPALAHQNGENGDVPG
jgi:hypothetical protein